jgi:hypothetical protein
MAEFWIGSWEYRRWWDGEPAHAVRPVASDGALGLSLSLVELERTGEEALLGRPIPIPVRAGTAVGVLVFRTPEGWNGRDPLPERELRFDSEPELYATPEECPVVTPERRERIRRGWGF